MLATPVPSLLLPCLLVELFLDLFTAKCLHSPGLPLSPRMLRSFLSFVPLVFIHPIIFTLLIVFFSSSFVTRFVPALATANSDIDARRYRKTESPADLDKIERVDIKYLLERM